MCECNLSWGVPYCKGKDCNNYHNMGRLDVQAEAVQILNMRPQSQVRAERVYETTGRRPAPHKVTVRLTDDQLAELDRLRKGMTRAEALRAKAGLTEAEG
jgi:hypothetical protein